MEQKLICIIYNYATNESKVVCAILEAELEKTSCSTHIQAIMKCIAETLLDEVLLQIGY